MNISNISTSLLALLVGCSAFAQTSTYVSVGNPAPYQDSTGINWQADNGCSAGSQFTSSAPIIGTPDPTLYQHGRFNATPFSCTYNLQNNIYYTVTLKFANVQGATAGQRIFNIVINNAVVRTNFDIATMGVGPNTAFDLGFVIPVSTGQITVAFNPVTGGGQINAIGITPLNSSSLTTGNFNNIRIVDGVRFAQTAAGINAADADLGTAIGEIWIPPTPLAGFTATDAQVSISKNHTLRVMGKFNIDTVNKGPILLATGSKILCNETDTSPIINVGVGTSPSVIRLAVQDGSVTDGLFVEHCLISAGIQPVTNGVIDASGSVNLAHVRDNYIFGFTSGVGIFVQDIQSGALGGTDNLVIQGNNITASNPGSGGCITVTHSATNAVTINNISIIDTTCIPGPSLASGAPISFINTAPSTKLEQINLLNVNIFAIPASQEGVYINGVFQATVKQVFCGNGTSCVYIANNANNLAVSADNIACSGCTNSLQDIANAYVNSNNYINHYGFNASSQAFSGNNIFQGVTTTPNFNGIRIIDGVRFAKSAAGINAADADCVATNNCEIWIAAPVTATDAQISITSGHTLKVMANLTIDSVNKGPILLANGTRLTCTGPSPDNNAEIVNSGTGTSVSMVRATTQDGSQTNMTIDGCFIYGGAQPFSNGIIDATGFALRGTIKDNKLAGHSSGTGIFIQDNQTGALGGTNNVEILNNTIIGSGTASCITISHGATNAVAISNILITDLFCVAGATSGNSVTIINSSTTASLLRQVHITNSTFNSTPVGGSSMSLGGVQNGSVRNATCLSGSSCVTITNNTNNGVIALDNIVNYNGNNTLLDQSAANVTITTPGLLHYDFPIGNTGQVGYLTNVSFLRLQGLNPAAAGTGFGTSPSLTFTSQSTNNGGILQVVAGTAPAASGTFTITFSAAQSTFGINPPSCEFTAHSTSGVWNARVSFIISSISTTSVVVNWDNNAVALTATSQYNIHYHCDAH